MTEMKRQAATATQPEIDSDRLRALLDGLNAFGHDPASGGYDRIGYSEADMAARDWFQAQMEADGLAVRRDGVANIFGRYGPSDGPAILVGSHIDTVPQGGAFDGALGVAIALECIRAMKAAGVVPKTAIEVVATAEEEGRFGGMLGSQALTGQISPAWLESATDSDGVRLQDAMAAHGLRARDALACARDDIDAFLELHIEQGPVLENRGSAIGVVEAVSGVSHLAVTLEGRANHSGTTPMEMRADAFVGLAEFAAQIPAIIASIGTDQSRITIGKIELEPNFPHTIPGKAVFSLITRDTDEAIQRKLVDMLKRRIEQSAARHGLAVAFEEKSWLAPVRLDSGLADLVARQSADLGLDHIRMPSGAGHDAQTMQARCPSALIFVPSRDGISHAPEEFTDWSDILAGARLMLAVLLDLANS